MIHFEINRATMRRCAGVTLLLFAAVANSPCALAADTVVVRTAAGNKESIVSGEVVDWVGGELVVRRASGKEERIPNDRVVRVESQWLDAHARGLQLQGEGKCDEALALFRKAVDAEKRTWVRRQILARIVECYSTTGNIDLAGDSFAALIGSDLQTPEFPVIPLNWTAMPTTAAIESKAVKWLASKLPAMRLLGASWLLTSGRRADAASALKQLSSDDDSRVAFLATAQRWRLELATAESGPVHEWQVILERIPEPLRAGPYYVVADALGRQKRHEEAALMFLRVPILYPQQRQLAAESLWSAANQLQQLGQTKEAETLYREIVTQHPSATCAAQARKRLEN